MLTATVVAGATARPRLLVVTTSASATAMAVAVPMAAGRGPDGRAILVLTAAAVVDGAILANAASEEAVMAAAVDLVVSMAVAVVVSGKATQVATANGHHFWQKVRRNGAVRRTLGRYKKFLVNTSFFGGQNGITNEDGGTTGGHEGRRFRFCRSLPARGCRTGSCFWRRERG